MRDLTLTYEDAARTQVNPADGLSASVQLLSAPTGNGIDRRTLTPTAVTLVNACSGAGVDVILNTSGGGDVIVLSPKAQLQPNTTYIFTVTSAVRDLNGVAFQPYSASFTTGSTPPVSGSAAFTQIPLGDYQKQANTTVPDLAYTSVVIGPDSNLYAATLTGEILRFGIDADGTLGTPQTITSVQKANGGPRTVIGMAFDPASTADNLVLWVSNNAPYDFQKGIPDWSGKITRLSGPDLGTVQDYVVGLPRSTKDHMTNSIAFNPREPGVLYFTQGSNSSYGDPDPIWDNRLEHLLNAALLRLDLSKLPAQLPLNVQTDDMSTPYDPYAPGAALTLYATGLRNSFSLLWHSNGSLYVPTNGSAAGGNIPAEPAPANLPASCQHRTDGAYKSRNATPAPAVTNVDWTEPDFLYKVVQGGYYGHPNPSRCEYVLDGGNPVGNPSDPTSVTPAIGDPPGNYYPKGVLSDPNYRGAVFAFPLDASADGVVEYKSSARHPVPALDHKLLVARFSLGLDLVALTPDANGNIEESILGPSIPGLTDFSPNPLNVVENPLTGDLYVAQLNYAPGTGPVQNGTITLVRPK